jgi:hypothetical protein
MRFNSNIFLLFFSFCFAELWHWRTFSISCISGDIFRIFLMGSSDHADNKCPQQDISRTYVPHEWINYGNKRHFFILVSAINRSPLRCMGKKVLSPHHSIFHLCTDTTHVNKLMVSLPHSFFHIIHVTNFIVVINIVYLFRWYFAMISISGVFAVTFSVVFAYVADVTTVEERSRAYGLVSATFAASLVIYLAIKISFMRWHYFHRH